MKRTCQRPVAVFLVRFPARRSCRPEGAIGTGAGAGAAGKRRSEATRNYEVDRTLNTASTQSVISVV